MGVISEEFRAVMGRFATGVTVVTTCDGIRPAGMTVNAFASVSLDPPLVLVCVERTTYIHDLLVRNGYFAVNILSDEQSEVSDCFAGRSEYRYSDFCGVGSHVAATGAPVFDEALGFVDCRIVNVFPGGDHSIFIGHVEALGGDEQRPLLYYRGTYPRLESPEE
jgi:flavin reductase (DIM6/NTAB) family NADH-FMN oxidoreductase RutF